mgnify:CR=1 FL=1
MTVTGNIAKYVENEGINLMDLSKESGVEYSMLYASLGHTTKRRELRADELTSICAVLRINPMDFAGTM